MSKLEGTELSRPVFSEPTFDEATQTVDPTGLQNFLLTNL
jgi:hypothetical protein